MRSNQGTVQLIFRRAFGEGLPAWIMEATATGNKVTMVIEAHLDEINSRIETLPVHVYDNRDLSGTTPVAVTHTIDFHVVEAKVNG